jgi:enoyl-CoA hydratase/carnithine racemase
MPDRRFVPVQIPQGDKAHLLSRHSEGLRIVYFSRPHTLNALDADTVKRLRRHLLALDDNPAVSTIVLRGRDDRVFCSGQDIRALWEAARGDKASRRRVIEYLREESELQWVVHTMTKPVVVVANGMASGSGYALAANAKFGYATAETSVLVPEVSMGLVPSGGASYHLSRTRSGVGMYAALTALPVRGEVAYWGGLLPYATTSEMVERYLPDVAGRIGNAPLREAELWADPQYRRMLREMRSGLPDEKREWLSRAAEKAMNPIAFDRLVDLEMWHKALKAGRPDLANELAEGAPEGEDPDFESLIPIDLTDEDGASLELGMAVDWWESREAYGLDGVPVPVEAHLSAAYDEAGTAAATLAAQWGAVPLEPSREALFQLKAIEAAFGGNVGAGDPILAVRADVRPARGGGSFLQPPPNAAKEALDAASRARLSCVADARSSGFDGAAASPAEEAVRLRWKRVPDRAYRPEYWRERAAARAGLIVTPPRPESVQPDDPHSALAALSGRPQPLPKDWESRIGIVEGSARGVAAGVHAAVLAAHEGLGLPARRISAAMESQGPEATERQRNELALRNAVDAAVRVGVQRAWPLGWMPAHITAECCEAANAPLDPDTRAVVRFATAVATARLHGQPDLALVPRQHWEAQSAEELRRRLAPGRMTDVQWSRLQEQFPVLAREIFLASPRDLSVDAQLNAIKRAAAQTVTSHARAQAAVGTRALVEEALRRGVPLRGPAAELASAWGLADRTGVATFASDGTPLSSRARLDGASSPTPFDARLAEILGGVEARAAGSGIAGVFDPAVGLSSDELRELQGLMLRLHALTRLIAAEHNRSVVEDAQQVHADAELRLSGGSGGSLSVEQIEAMEAAQEHSLQDAEGRAMPTELGFTQLKAAVHEAAALKVRLEELALKQQRAMDEFRESLAERRTALSEAEGMLPDEQEQRLRDGLRRVALQGEAAMPGHGSVPASALSPKQTAALAAQVEAAAHDDADGAGSDVVAATERVETIRQLASTGVHRVDRVMQAGAAGVAMDAEILARAEAGRVFLAQDTTVRPQDIPHGAGAAADAQTFRSSREVDALGRPLAPSPMGPEPLAQDLTVHMDETSVDTQVANAQAINLANDPVALAAYVASAPTADGMELDDLEVEQVPDVTPELEEHWPLHAKATKGALAPNVYTRDNPYRHQLDVPIDTQWQPTLGDVSEWTAPPEFVDPKFVFQEDFALDASREHLAFLPRADPAQPAHDDFYVVPGRLGINYARAEEGVLPRAARFSSSDPAPRRAGPQLGKSISAAIGFGGTEKDKTLSTVRRVRQLTDSVRQWYRKLLEKDRTAFEELRPTAARFGIPVDGSGTPMEPLSDDGAEQDSVEELMAQASTLVRAVNQALPASEAAVQSMAEMGIAERLERVEESSWGAFQRGQDQRRALASAASELGMVEEAKAASEAGFEPVYPPEKVAALASEHAQMASRRVHHGLELARALMEGGQVPAEQSVAFAAGDETAADAYVSAAPADGASTLGFAVLDDRKRAMEGALPSHVEGGLRVEAPVRSSLVSKHGSLGLFAHGDGTFAPWATGGDWKGASDVDRRAKRTEAHIGGANDAGAARNAWMDAAYRANEFSHGRVILGGDRERAARERLTDKATDLLAAYETSKALGQSDAPEGMLATLLRSLTLDLDPLVQATRSLVGASGMTYPTLEAHDQAILAVRAGFKAAHRADEFDPTAASVTHELPPAAQGSIDLEYYADELHREDLVRRGKEATWFTSAHLGGIRGPQDLAGDIVASPPLGSEEQAAADAAINSALAGEAAAGIADAPLNVRSAEHGGQGTAAKVAEVVKALDRLATDRTKQVIELAGTSLDALARAALRREALREAVSGAPRQSAVVAARALLAEDEATRSSKLPAVVAAIYGPALASAGFLDPTMEAAEAFAKRAPHVSAMSRSLFGAPSGAGPVAEALSAPVKGTTALGGAPSELAALGGDALRHETDTIVSSVETAGSDAHLPLEADGRMAVGADSSSAAGVVLPNRVDEIAASVLAHSSWLRHMGFSRDFEEATKAAADRVHAMGLDTMTDVRNALYEELLRLEEEAGVELSQADRMRTVDATLRTHIGRSDVDERRRAMLVGNTLPANSGIADEAMRGDQAPVVDDAHLALMPAPQPLTQSEREALREIAFGPGALRLYGEEVVSLMPSPQVTMLAREFAPDQTEEQQLVASWALDRVEQLAEEALDARLLGRPDLADMKDAERQAYVERFGIPDPGDLTLDKWLSSSGVEEQLKTQYGNEAFEQFRRAAALQHVETFGRAPEWADAELRARLLGMSRREAEVLGRKRALQRAVMQSSHGAVEVDDAMLAELGLLRGVTNESLKKSIARMVESLAPEGGQKLPLPTADLSLGAREAVLEELLATIEYSHSAMLKAHPAHVTDHLAQQARLEAATLRGSHKSGATTVPEVSSPELDQTTRNVLGEAAKHGQEAVEATRGSMEAVTSAADALASGSGSVLDRAVVDRFRAGALSAPARYAARQLVAEARDARKWLSEEMGKDRQDPHKVLSAIERVTEAQLGLRAVVRGDQGAMSEWLNLWMARQREASAAAGVQEEAALLEQVVRAGKESGVEDMAFVEEWALEHPGSSFGAHQSARTDSMREWANPEVAASEHAVALGARGGLGFAKAALDGPVLGHEEVAARLEMRNEVGDDPVAHAVTPLEGDLARSDRPARDASGAALLADAESFNAVVDPLMPDDVVDAMIGEAALEKRPMARIGAAIKEPSARGVTTLHEDVFWNIADKTSLAELDPAEARADFWQDGPDSDQSVPGLLNKEPIITAQTASGAGLQLMDAAAKAAHERAQTSGTSIVASDEGADGGVFDTVAAGMEPVTGQRAVAPASHQRDPAVIVTPPGVLADPETDLAGHTVTHGHHLAYRELHGTETDPADGGKSFVMAVSNGAVPSADGGVAIPPSGAPFARELRAHVDAHDLDQALSSAKARTRERLAKDMEAHLRAIFVQEARVQRGDVAARHPLLADYRTPEDQRIPVSKDGTLSAEVLEAAVSQKRAGDELLASRIGVSGPPTRADLAAPADPAAIPLAFVDALEGVSAELADAASGPVPSLQRKQAITLARQAIARHGTAPIDSTDALSLVQTVLMPTHSQETAKMAASIVSAAGKASPEVLTHPAAVELTATTHELLAQWWGEGKAPSALASHFASHGSVTKAVPLGSLGAATREKMPVNRADQGIASTVRPGEASLSMKEAAAQIVARARAKGAAAIKRDVTRRQPVAAAWEQDADAPEGSVGRARAESQVLAALGYNPPQLVIPASADGSQPMDGPLMLGLPTPPASQVPLDPEAMLPPSLEEGGGELGLEAALRLRPMQAGCVESQAMANALQLWAVEQPESVATLESRAGEAPAVMNRVLQQGYVLAGLRALEQRSARRRQGRYEAGVEMVMERAGLLSPAQAPGDLPERAVKAVWDKAAARVAALDAAAPGVEKDIQRIREQAAAAAREVLSAMRPSHSVPLDSGAREGAPAAVHDMGRTLSEAWSRAMEISSWASENAASLADNGTGVTTLPNQEQSVHSSVEDELASVETLLEAAAAQPGRRSVWAAVLLNEMRSQEGAAVAGGASLAAWTLAGRVALARLLGDDVARAVGVAPKDAARVEAYLRMDGVIAPATTAAEEAVDAAVDATLGSIVSESPVVRAAYTAIARRIQELGGPTSDLNPSTAPLRPGLTRPSLASTAPIDLLSPGGTLAERDHAALERQLKPAAAQGATPWSFSRGSVVNFETQVDTVMAANRKHLVDPSRLPPLERSARGEETVANPRSVSYGSVEGEWKKHPEVYAKFAPHPTAQQLAWLGILSREEAVIRGIFQPGQTSAADNEGEEASSSSSEAEEEDSPAALASTSRPRHAFLAPASERLTEEDFVRGDKALQHTKPRVKHAIGQRRAIAKEALDRGEYWTMADTEAAQQWEAYPAPVASALAQRVLRGRFRGGKASLGMLEKMGELARLNLSPQDVESSHPDLSKGGLFDAWGRTAMHIADSAQLDAGAGRLHQRLTGMDEASRERTLSVSKLIAGNAAAEEREEFLSAQARLWAEQREWNHGLDPFGRRWTPLPGLDGATAHRTRENVLFGSGANAFSVSNPLGAEMHDRNGAASTEVEVVRQAVDASLLSEAAGEIMSFASVTAKAAASRQIAAIQASFRGDSSEGPVSVAGVLPIWAEVAGLATAHNPDAHSEHPEVTRRRAAELAHYHERFIRSRDRDAAGVGWASVIDADKTDRDLIQMRAAFEAEAPKQDSYHLTDGAKAAVTHDPDRLVHALGLPLEPRVEQAAVAATQRFEDMDAWRTAVPLPRSVEEIRRRLQAQDTPFSREALRAMDSHSPTAVAATHRLLVEAGRSSLARTLQMEWRVNSRLREHHDFVEVAGAKLFDGDSSKAGEFLPGISGEELDALFAPLRPEQELVLGRRDHIDRHRSSERRKAAWHAKALDALERGEGEGYLGELFRRRYDYVYDPDHHVFDVNADYLAEAAMAGRDKAMSKGYLDAKTASYFLRKGLPAAQGELEPRVHPRAAAMLGRRNGILDEETGEPFTEHATLRHDVDSLGKAKPSALPDVPQGMDELAQSLGLVDANNQSLVAGIDERV